MTTQYLLAALISDCDGCGEPRESLEGTSQENGSWQLEIWRRGMRCLFSSFANPVLKRIFYRKNILHDRQMRVPKWRFAKWQWQMSSCGLPFGHLMQVYATQFFSPSLVNILRLSSQELSWWLCLEIETRSPRWWHSAPQWWQRQQHVSTQSCLLCLIQSKYGSKFTLQFYNCLHIFPKT